MRLFVYLIAGYIIYTTFRRLLTYKPPITTNPRKGISDLVQDDFSGVLFEKSTGIPFNQNGKTLWFQNQENLDAYLGKSA